MNKQEWNEHLTSWEKFLYTRLATINEEDKRERKRLLRQIRTLERVRCGAALNPQLVIDFINPSKFNNNSKACHSFTVDLNESQQRAVNAAFNNKNTWILQVLS